ncbi:MAG TPA: NB-ARC domain-containing protein, partial [Ktedonobacteraceae bacterium]|nr:NB-ARC domain-containing protein [Ktedonobacteraceae bacterium]
MLTITSDPFGVLLKQFRKRQRITQNQLAEAMRVHRNTVGRWEEGTFLPASKALLVDLARCLHLDESEARQLLDASLLTPTPLWSVPYPRNPFFTGREDLLETLQARLAPGQPVALTQSYALHGLGGIGKTQLALEYAYRYAVAYRAVFWIGAETVEQIHASLLHIAERLELPEHSEADQQRLMMAVQRWLETNKEWLLIWDNLEDLDLLRRYLPSIQTGTVLITTRSQTLGTVAQGINLAPMEKEEGALFLLRRAKFFASDARCEQLHHLVGCMSADYAAALDLVTALGGLPLALDQAGAYIEETKCGFTEFLALFQRYPLQLLQERGTHGEHPTSVVKTFVLSFEKLQQTQKASAELLIACCFLAPEEIPETLFTDHAIWFPPG